MATEQQVHFLLVPFSEQGHLNSMLSLASHLLHLRCRVTFVTADRTLPLASSSDDGAQSQAYLACATPSAVHTVQEHERLRFVTLPVRNKTLCVDAKTMTRHQIFKATLAGLEDRQDLIAAIIEESKASSHPLHCLISDSLLWRWMRRMASTHRLAFAQLCPVSALYFYTIYLGAVGKEEEVDEHLVSHYGMPTEKDSTAYFGLLDMQDPPDLRFQKKKVLYSFLEGIEEAGTILINSFEALEAPVLPSLQAYGLDTKLKFIGPCLAVWDKDVASNGTSLGQQAGSIFTDDTTCLEWLDKQEKGSVLYVAFGSEGEMAPKQVEEIGLGIEESGHKFLWVQPNASKNSWPLHSLFNQSSGQSIGMVVSWAPQTRVLQHYAVGGFFTHSGWNSTLESLTFGVPMLCLPLRADQPLTALFVQDFLQVGIRLSVSEEGLVHRGEIASGVQAIMQGRFSQKVSQIQELAKMAIPKACSNLASFVQKITCAK